MSRYREIAQDLVLQITSGRQPVGGLLPTEMNLMEQYGASRTTVRSALRELQEMGLISRRRNRGTQVIGLPRAGAFTQSLDTLDDLVTLAQTAKRKILSSKEVVIDVAQARDIGCAPGSRWLQIRLLRQQDGAKEPLGWTEAYIDPRYERLPRLAAKHPEQLFCDLIETLYGRRIAFIEQTISGCLLAPEIAKILGEPEDSAGLTIRRQYRDSARALVLVTVSIYPAHRYSLKTTLVRRSVQAGCAATVHRNRSALDMSGAL